nr:NS1 [Rat bocavirus]WOA03352.1 NS1 [Rat bocavirus]
MGSENLDISNDPGFIETLRMIKRFEEPCFTYVMKLPYEDPSLCEPGLQFLLRNGIWEDMLHSKTYYMENYSEHSPQILYTAHYGYTLGTFGYWACERTFRNRQQTSQPKFDSYVQVEISKSIHVHIVIGGKGLTKYTAKSFRKDLGIQFFTQIEQRFKESLGEDYGKPQWEHLTKPIETARRQCMNGDPTLVTILQYTSRRGETYSCRVDPKSFIRNYLLPKNLLMNTYTTPETHTPTGNWFAGTGKTYSMTFIKDQFIDPTHRRPLIEALDNDFAVPSSGPVHTGDPGGELPKVSRASWSNTATPGGKMNKREALALDLVQRAHDENLLTYEDLVANHPELVIMIENQPGGDRMLQNTLHMIHVQLTQRYTALTYIQKRFEDAEVETDNKVVRLLNMQGYNPWQVGHWICCMLDKKAGKQNTVCFFGPASTGKTNLAKAIVNAVGLYGCVNHQNRNFIFNDCAAKLIVWWEEGLMHQDWVEQAKCCLGGTSFRIDRKHKDSQVMLQTPCIISTNNNMYECTGSNYVTQVHAKPLKDRIVQINFMKPLPSTFGEISTEECAGWLMDCCRMFQCTLEGFYERWEIEKMPNGFPLGKLCASHSQDFLLQENGICISCGGYLPLTTDTESASTSERDDPGEYIQILN